MFQYSRTIASIVWQAGLLSKVENSHEISTGQLLVTDSKRLSTFRNQLRAIVLLWYGGTGTSIGNLSHTWDANKNKTSEGFGGTMSAYGFTSAGTGYDDEDRLTGYARTNGTLTQSWNLTKVGDWTSVTTNGTAQNRTHGPTARGEGSCSGRR